MTEYADESEIDDVSTARNDFVDLDTVRKYFEARISADILSHQQFEQRIGLQARTVIGRYAPNVIERAAYCRRHTHAGSATKAVNGGEIMYQVGDSKA